MYVHVSCQCPANGLQVACKRCVVLYWSCKCPGVLYLSCKWFDASAVSCKEPVIPFKFLLHPSTVLQVFHDSPDDLESVLHGCCIGCAWLYRHGVGVQSTTVVDWIEFRSECASYLVVSTCLLAIVLMR